MFRIISLIGHILLFICIMVLAIDAILAWQTGTFRLETLWEIWTAASLNSLSAAMQFFQNNSILPWHDIFVRILYWPAALDFFVSGLVFSIIGRLGAPPA